MFFKQEVSMKEVSMSAEVVAQTIQLVIAPTVMISGCTMIQNGILNRYNNIGTRLRSLNRERAELLSINDMPAQVFGEAIHLLDRQLVSLSHRHQLIQKASLILYGTITLFLGSMLVIFLSKIFSFGEFSEIALLLFLLGNTSLLIGVILGSLEIHLSHQAIRAEVEWVMTLSKSAFQSGHHPLKASER
jgi:hypothetical protein